MDLKKTALGIELGSTRIKAVLIDENHIPVASGDYEWENQLVNGIWTYSMEAVHTGLRACFAALKADLKEEFGVELTTVGAIGVSAMMHGYLPFDKDGKQLAEFRTWRNTITGEAAEKLTALFGFNIPQRWSIAHLYQAMLNGEEHVKDIAYLTTLAGYIHWKLTGEKVMGIGEASGMFPIDSETGDYDVVMLQKFLDLTGLDLRTILPKVLPAGACGGMLTEAGARFLDPSGTLLPGIPVAPCEGDAGTGMTATNAVAPRTGNVSAGTSIFSMIVLEKPLSKPYPEIDIVTTPTGKPVAMVHCNNCTNDSNAWVQVLKETAELFGAKPDMGDVYTKLYQKSLEGETDCGGIQVCNYMAGEHVTHQEEGRPMVVRRPDSAFTLANFFRATLYATMATLKIGMDILKSENVAIDCLTGHGGLFKTPGVGQRYLAAACGAPVTCMETAGEGGPYGAALLAAYALRKEAGESLEQFLSQKVFGDAKKTTLAPDEKDMAGFNAWLKGYRALLEVERRAAELL